MKKPIYLLAGGNWRDSKTLLPRFRKILADTKKRQPIISYIGTANNDSTSFFQFAGTIFQQAGAQALQLVRLADSQADVRQTKSILCSADAIFVSGGDVEQGMDWLRQHKLIDYLRELYESGTLFFGLSAGSIMLCQYWVRWSDPKNNATAELFACLGLAPLVCDTHDEHSGWEELKTVVRLLGDQTQGYGIPTGGVLKVGAQGELKALDKTIQCFANRQGQVVKVGALTIASSK